MTDVFLLENSKGGRNQSNCPPFIGEGVSSKACNRSLNKLQMFANLLLLRRYHWVSIS